MLRELAGALFPTPTLRVTRPKLALFALAAVLISAMGGPPARALDEPAGEKEALKACEKRVCTMILDKPRSGEDLSCKMSKTWAQSSIKGGERKGISWGFGDARCRVDLRLGRAEIVAALTRPTYTISSAPITVNCEVERSDGVHPVKATATPKLVFKNGKADKVWINLKELDGPEDIKGTVWVAANLEDSIGIFHKSLIKSINKFIYKKCPDGYGPQSVAKQSAPKKAGEGTTASAAGSSGAAATGAKAESAKAESGKVPSTKPDSGKTESTKAESAKGEGAKVASEPAETGKAPAPPPPAPAAQQKATAGP